MFSITPQERRIITFLVVTLLIGCAVRLGRHLLSGRPPDIAIVSPELPGGAGPDPSVPFSGQAAHDAAAPDSGDAGPPAKININTAGPEQLQSLSGIGPRLARRIVEYRREHGPFSKPADITSVPGIGEKTFQRLHDRITSASGDIPGKDRKN
jgi:competence ComEA-like helix-hairpin-helix protein